MNIILVAVALLLFTFGGACMWPVAYGAGYRRCDRDIAEIPRVDWSRETWRDERELSRPGEREWVGDGWSAEQREVRSNAAWLIAHLRAERGEEWTPTGVGGAHHGALGTVAQRRYSRAAEQRLMHAAWNNPTSQESVITVADMRHLTDDWRQAVQPIPVAQIGDAT